MVMVAISPPRFQIQTAAHHQLCLCVCMCVFNSKIPALGTNSMIFAVVTNNS